MLIRCALTPSSSVCFCLLCSLKHNIYGRSSAGGWYIFFPWLCTGNGQHHESLLQILCNQQDIVSISWAAYVYVADKLPQAVSTNLYHDTIDIYLIEVSWYDSALVNALQYLEAVSSFIFQLILAVILYYQPDYLVYSLFIYVIQYYDVIHDIKGFLSNVARY